MHADKLHVVLEAGWSLLNPWPGAFRPFLDEFLAGAGARKAKRGLAKAYGPLTALVLKKPGEGWAAPLLVEMVDRLVGHPDISVRSSLVGRHGSGRNESARHLTLDEAARMIGVSPNTISRRAARLELEGNTVSRWGQRQRQQADIALLADRMAEADGISQREAARTLGVATKTVRRLADAGALTLIPLADRMTERTAYSRKDVEGLLRIMESAAAGKPTVDKPGPQHRVIGGGGTRDGFGILKIVPAVLAGDLVPVAVSTSGKGLKRYLFRKSFAQAG